MALLIDWIEVRQRGLQALVSSPVGAMFSNIFLRPAQDFVRDLVLSLCIGVLCWLTFEAGLLLAPPHNRYPGGSPKGWRGPGLIVASIAVGVYGGARLGDQLGCLPPERIEKSLLVTSVVIVVNSLYFLLTSNKRAALRARITAAERNASLARLMLLQSQLEPHMLFNTLANLRALIDVNPAAAQAMLDRLNDFLRTTLDASRATTHPLSAEFNRLRDYLTLMSIRMGPRLTFDLRLPDDLGRQPVPPLLLQPLVENAIKHGLDPLVEGGRIEVSAAREGNMLALTVRDSGAGFDADAPARKGSFGLTQVIDRVASAYDGRGHVDVWSRPGEGATVLVRLPLQPARQTSGSPREPFQLSSPCTLPPR